jgi:hypothetical protein
MFNISGRYTYSVCMEEFHQSLHIRKMSKYRSVTVSYNWWSLRSEICEGVDVFTNVVTNHTTIVCIGWLKLYKCLGGNLWFQVNMRRTPFLGNTISFIRMHVPQNSRNYGKIPLFWKYGRYHLFKRTYPKIHVNTKKSL